MPALLMNRKNNVTLSPSSPLHFLGVGGSFFFGDVVVLFMYLLIFIVISSALRLSADLCVLSAGHGPITTPSKRAHSSSMILVGDMQFFVRGYLCGAS